MTKIIMIQTKDVPGIAMVKLFLSLEHLIFEFVSNFDIRPALARMPMFKKVVTWKQTGYVLRDSIFTSPVLGQGFRILSIVFF